MSQKVPKTRENAFRPAELGKKGQWAARAGFPNPERIPASSPRLRAARYLG
jgi:hypothetical protein